MVVGDIFSKYGWITPLNSKISQTKKLEENVLISSKRKPNLIDTDRGKNFLNKITYELLHKNAIKRSSCYTSRGAVFAERFNRTVRDLLGRLVCEKGDANLTDVTPTIAKHFKNRVQLSANLTPIEISLKKNERYVFLYLLDK